MMEENKDLPKPPENIFVKNGRVIKQLDLKAEAEQFLNPPLARQTPVVYAQNAKVYFWVPYIGARIEFSGNYLSNEMLAAVKKAIDDFINTP